jgi:predicted double-glycine peptidase
VDHPDHRGRFDHSAGRALTSGADDVLNSWVALVRAVSVFCCVAFTSAVAAAQNHAGYWIDVPFVQQSEDGCGSAAISMVLQYWNAHGKPVDSGRRDVEAIQRLLFSSKARGIYASDLEKYIRESGFEVFAIQGTWPDLEKHLEQGRPLIVATQPTGRKAAFHYAVAVGMDAQAAAVLLNDPARGKLLRMERAEFEKEWQATGHWMLLAVPRQAK